MFNLSIILGFVALYFVAILGIVIWARWQESRRILPTLTEFFVANRNMSTFVLSLSFLGTLNNVYLMAALPANVYADGIGAVGATFLGLVIAPFLFIFIGFKVRELAHKYDCLSPVELISKTYQSRLLGVCIAVLMIFLLSPFISLQLVALGKVLESLSGGEIPYLTSIGVTVGIILIYVILGGIRSIAYTDVVQTLAIYVGLFFGTVLFIDMHWSGVGEMFSQAAEQKPDHLTLPGPHGKFTLPVFVSVVFFFAGYYTQPQMAARIIMARDNRQVATMITIAALIFMVAYIAPILFGVGGALLYDLEDPNHLIGHILKTMMDAGLYGTFVAGLLVLGIVGAAMSTADSMLLNVGQMFTRDVINPFFKTSRNTQIWVARCVMVLILGLAFFLGINPPPLMIELAFYSLKGSALIAPIYLGFTWKYRDAKVAIFTLILGVSILLYMAINNLNPYGLADGFWALLICTITYIGGCLIIKKPQ